jgi:hypothetical protein
MRTVPKNQEAAKTCTAVEPTYTIIVSEKCQNGVRMV